MEKVNIVFKKLLLSDNGIVLRVFKDKEKAVDFAYKMTQKKPNYFYNVETLRVYK